MLKIALIGAGAVGGYFIWGFHENPNIELTVIAENERKQKLISNGIKINNENYYPNILTSQEAGVQDVVLIATKYSGLENVIEIIPSLIGKNTIVMSLLNGVDSEEKIANAIGWNHVEYSFMKIASKRDENGIVFRPEITSGLFAGIEKLSDEVKQIFQSSKIRCTFEENIIQDMWIKYASNIANNLPQAVLGINAALFTDSEHGRFLAEKLWAEVYEVAMKKGIDVGEKAVIFTEVPKSSKYSTLQDIEAGRHTEVDMFAGHLIEMARELQIDVPYTEYTYHAIKALEEKNDGKFDC